MRQNYSGFFAIKTELSCTHGQAFMARVCCYRCAHDDAGSLREPRYCSSSSVYLFTICSPCRHFVCKAWNRQLVPKCGFYCSTMTRAGSCLVSAIMVRSCWSCGSSACPFLNCVCSSCGHEHHNFLGALVGLFPTFQKFCPDNNFGAPTATLAEAITLRGFGLVNENQAN